MNDELRRRWRAISESFALPFRPLAARIAAHDAAGFETLWLMADFGQLCVRYSALLVLAHGYRHPEVRQTLFSNIPPRSLERATFGTWVSFLQHGSGALGYEARLAGWPFGPDCFPRLRTLVQRRNELAHGALGRFEPDEAFVNALAEDVLQIAELLQPICVQEPGPLGHGEPFVITGAAGGDSLLYDGIDERAAWFMSSQKRERLLDEAYPAIGPKIRGYLASVAPATESPRRPTAPSLAQQTLAQLRELRADVDNDYFVTTRYFGELPLFAGRPALAGRTIDALRDTGEAYGLHLYGPRGSGKRNFLADLLDRLATEGHVVVLLRLSKGSPPSGDIVGAALGLTGDVAAVSEAVRGSGVAGRLVVAVSDFGAAWAREPFRPALAAFGRSCRNARVGLLLLSDTSDLDTSLTDADWCMHEAMPRMEPEATAAFFARVIDKPGHSPLTDWDLLSEAVTEHVSNPSSLVTLCQVYNGRPLDGFDANDYKRTLWRDLVAPPPGSVELRPLVTELAAMMRVRRRRWLNPWEPYEGVPDRQKAARARDLELLQLLGYVVIDERIRFAEFEWLMRALVLTLGEHSADLDAEQLGALVRETSDFTPLGDALAEWTSDEPAARVRAVFAVVLEAGTENRGRLVHAFLARAYSHEDTSLLGDLVEDALATRDEALCRGCAGVAQQMTQDGHPEAVRLGGVLFDRCLRASRAHGLERLQATLLNEHAQYFVGETAVAARERAFTAAAALARSHGLRDVEHTATNNLAEIRLRRLPPRSGEANAQDREAARGIVADLTPFAGETPGRDDWTRVQLTRQLLARAAGYLGAEEHEPMRLWGRGAVELATRFGSFADRCRAHERWAFTLADSGLQPEATTELLAAARFARLSAQAVAEADCERDLARLVWAHGLRQGSEPRVAAADAFVHYRLARRALSVLPAKSRAVGLRQGMIWFDMAQIYDRIGEARSAMDSARKSLAAYEAAGEAAQMDRIRKWAARRGESGAL